MIVRTPGTLGGRPRIDGTRIDVDTVWSYWCSGFDMAALTALFSRPLTTEQIVAAVRYGAEQARAMRWRGKRGERHRAGLARGIP